MKVLFLCVANSARSQLAEGLAKNIWGDTAEVASAGSEPSGKVHPGAIRSLRRLDIDITANTSKSIDDLDPNFVKNLDFVITLCAEEACPIFRGSVKKLHWPMPDPADASPDEVDSVFDRVRDEIRAKIVAFPII